MTKCKKRSMMLLEIESLRGEQLNGAASLVLQCSAGTLITVSMLAPSSISISVKPWVGVPDFVPARGEINKAIVEAFRSRNIVIPFSQHEVRMLENAG
jgi:small-conductance mechanosensitive channel